MNKRAGPVADYHYVREVLGDEGCPVAKCEDLASIRQALESFGDEAERRRLLYRELLARLDEADRDSPAARSADIELNAALKSN